MKRLNKIQNIVFITGAVLLLIGAATFFTGWLYAFYLYTVGACAFAAMQLRAGYEGDNFVIRRLRGQQVIGALLLVCTAFFMAMRIFDFGFAADRNGWYAWQSLACWNCTPLFVFRPNWRRKSHEKTTISFKTEKTSLNSDKTLYPLVISAYLCTPISPE